MFSPLTLYEFVPHPLDALVANVLGDVSSRSIDATLRYLSTAALSSGDNWEYSAYGSAESSKRGGLVCLNSAARFDKWNRAAVR